MLENSFSQTFQCIMFTTINRPAEVLFVGATCGAASCHINFAPVPAGKAPGGDQPHWKYLSGDAGRREPDEAYRVFTPRRFGNVDSDDTANRIIDFGFEHRRVQFPVHGLLRAHYDAPGSDPAYHYDQRSRPGELTLSGYLVSIP